MLVCITSTFARSITDLMMQKLTRTSTMSPWVAITTLSNTSIMGRIIAKGRVAEGTRIISDHVQQCIAEKDG